jgi:Ras-related protein Rab-34
MCLRIVKITMFIAILRFCHSVFDQNYKATIGVDFEVERFDVLQVPFNLQM